MQASSSPVEDLIPHRPPMSLIDEVVSFDRDAGAIEVRFRARREWCESWAAVEYMAQAAAALSGAADREAGYGGPPRPGFLLGTRRMDLFITRFEPGREYLAAARTAFSDGNAASFECEILDGGKSVARAVLNAFRPDVTDGFPGAR